MLPWWGWLLLWTVLLVGSAALLGARARRVWASTQALGREVERAGAMVAELEARADELRDLEPGGPPAAVQDPRRVRAQYRRERALRLTERRARRADRLPPWARVH
ncbi:hypothetical protein GCM10023168_18600 [Fodinibacter luteus]|uniref:Uncharacterized protein n=1 Tax=Fodinibacter luteus TaxID=552064 RepID=A0ABP8KEU4_9MICO